MGKVAKKALTANKKKNHTAKSTDKNRQDIIADSTGDEYKIPHDLIQEHIYSFGRPTKYRAKMCIELMLIMAEGRTFENATTLMCITEESLRNWLREPTEEKPNSNFKPDFFKAYKAGEKLRKLWWDEIGRINLNNKNFNNTLYMMFRQNLDGWTRRLEGKIETKHEEIHTERKELSVHVEVTEDYAAAVGQILAEYGAIEPATETAINTETH